MCWPFVWQQICAISWDLFTPVWYNHQYILGWPPLRFTAKCPSETQEYECQYKSYKYFSLKTPQRKLILSMWLNKLFVAYYWILFLGNDNPYYDINMKMFQLHLAFSVHYLPSLWNNLLGYCTSTDTILAYNMFLISTLYVEQVWWFNNTVIGRFHSIAALWCTQHPSIL